MIENDGFGTPGCASDCCNPWGRKEYWHHLPGHTVWSFPWWDDCYENGGACIGSRSECEDCDWSETF